VGSQGGRRITARCSGRRLRAAAERVIVIRTEARATMKDGEWPENVNGLAVPYGLPIGGLGPSLRCGSFVTPPDIEMETFVGPRSKCLAVCREANLMTYSFGERSAIHRAPWYAQPATSLERAVGRKRERHFGTWPARATCRPALPRFARSPKSAAKPMSMLLKH
jgi:hypothetical protein